ncbi:cytochrome P450, partial [Zopfia rhizophila CBS 207.26]
MAKMFNEFPFLAGLNASQVAIIAISIFFVRVVFLVVYRLCFHPLRGIPGPKLAAVTFWYEFYYDCIQRGQYVFKIEQLHKQYGNIVRINPSEVHFADPDFFNEIYCGANKKRTKWEWMTSGLFINHSIFGTVPHDLHRERRAAVSSLFSKAQVRRQQGDIQERVDTMLERLKIAGENGKIIDLKVAFPAFTADVAMNFAYGEGDDKLNTPDFDPNFALSVERGLNSLSLMNHLPWLGYPILLLRYAPERLILKLRMTSFMAAQKNIGKQARRIMSEQNTSEKARPTIFQQIMASKLPPSEKTYLRLVQDAGLVISAGTVSTAWALTVGTFHLLSEPEALQKLQAELLEVIPNRSVSANVVELEKLPYLAAVIQESLRLSVGGSHRSQRISPDEATIFTDRGTNKMWSIPSGTPMSMSHLLLFRDERIFPSHEKFRPERWLNNPAMERYQFAWSKGTRNCLGMNLAMAEILLMFAGIFRNFESGVGLRIEDSIGRIELFETDVSDVETVGDGGVPLQKPGSKGVRVRVLGRT